MGSVSISHLIIFIASVAGTLITGVEQVSNSVDRQSEDLTRHTDTDVAIISDPVGGSVYNESNQTLILLVKNTGRAQLKTDGSNLDVLLDGQYRSDLSVEVISGGERWSSGAVAEVTVSVGDELAPGDHHATVIVHGSRATFDFYY